MELRLRQWAKVKPQHYSASEYELAKLILHALGMRGVALRCSKIRHRLSQLN